MSARASFLRLPVLVVLSFLGLGLPGFALSPSAAVQDSEVAGDRPDFSGVWVFNEERSDDLHKLVEEAVGPDFTQGDAKREVVRVWIRRWLMGVLEDPNSRHLTIEQTSEDFKTGLGDEVSIYYFAREASSRGPAGGTLKVNVSWKGQQLITEERSEDGGRITCLYTMLPGGKTLILGYLLEHKKLKKPLEAHMFFDRDEGDD